MDTTTTIEGVMIHEDDIDSNDSFGRWLKRPQANRELTMMCCGDAPDKRMTFGERLVRSLNDKSPGVKIDPITDDEDDEMFITRTESMEEKKRREAIKKKLFKINKSNKVVKRKLKL